MVLTLISSSIDHSWVDDTFVTCSSVLNVWSPERQECIHHFAYQTESLLKAKFNPAEPGLVASTTNERGIVLYDVLIRLTDDFRFVLRQFCEKYSLVWLVMILLGILGNQ